MRFYTQSECEQWLRGLERTRPDEKPSMRKERIGYPPTPHQIFYFAQWISTHFLYHQPALLWMTEWGIWGSSENWHLYYKLRQSYSDQRLLHEAAGHYFLGYEAEDLASFLQVAMLNGWGGYLLTQAGCVDLFFSHDEYIDFFSEAASLAEVREELGKLSGPLKV